MITWLKITFFDFTFRSFDGADFLYRIELVELKSMKFLNFELFFLTGWLTFSMEPSGNYFLFLIL